MNIKIYEDRKLLNESDEFGNQYENLATTLIFEFPEFVEKDGVQFATKELNKTIIFNIEGDNELPIIGNKFSFPYDITKLGEVVWNICLKEKSDTEDMTDKLIWYSETMTSNFGNTNEGHNKITTQKLDAFNVINTTLNEKIAEVEALKIDIGDYKEALDKKVDKEQGKELSTNDFTDILKEKLESLENYNDTEIRNLLEASLKDVSYTANNGILTFTKNDGKTIQIDLPLELLIQSGRYDEANKQIVLVLANGNSINIPVSSLLDDFYGKGETYNKTEVNDLISQKQKQIEALEDEIGELKEENQKQQEELDILNSEYTEKELEGETVVITNGLPKSKIKSKVKGNTYQDTREGYQLLNIKKLESGATSIDLTVDDEDYVYDTTPTSDSRAISYENSNWKVTLSSGTYTLYVIFKTLCTNTYGGIYIRDINENKIADLTIKALNSRIFSFTLNEETDIGILAKVFDGYARFLLVKGEYTEDTIPPYEQYGSKPSIPFPSEIEVIDTVNKLDYSDFGTKTGGGMTLEYTEDGYIVGNGTQTANWVTFWNKDITDELEDGETITLKAEDYKNGLLKTSFYCQIAAYKEDGTRVNYFVDTKEAVFTVDKSTYVRYVASISVADQTITLNNEKNRFMLYKDTGYKPWLPYGHIGYIHRGKNIYCNVASDIHIKNNSIDYEIIDNNTLKLFTTQSTNWGFLQFRKKGFKKGQTYKFSCEFINSNSLIENTYILLRGANTGTTYFTSTVTNGQKIEFTPDDTEVYVRFNTTQATAMENTTVYSKIQISEVGGEFEPYIEPKTISINLAGNKLALNDNAEISVSGSVKANKVMKEYVFTGDEDWKIASSVAEGTTRFYFEKSDVINNINVNARLKSIYSNRFKALSWQEIYTADTTTINGISVYDNNTGEGHRIVIRIDNNVASTVEELKAYLKENETYCYYVSNTPETINLPSIEPITLFEGTNVFELVTNLDTTMAVTYKVSNKKKILSLEERISALESAVIGG